MDDDLPTPMTLREVIALLELHDPGKLLRVGFGSADSYRGYYEYLAFEPDEDVTVGQMLRYAKAAVDSMYQGYKGGDYIMTLDTPCYIAHYGECDGDNDILTEERLQRMLDSAEDTDA